MAIITSTASGLWSDTATWAGGVLPANNDAVVIAAGHEVQADVDISGFGSGIGGVTIQGHATTPGMLYVKSGASAFLKTTFGQGIQGTSGAVKGRLLINDDGDWNSTVPLDSATTARFMFTGVGVTGTFLDVRAYALRPTRRYVNVYKDKYDFTANGSTVNTSTHRIDLGTTPPANNTYIAFVPGAGAVLPGGLVEGVLYRVSNVSGNTFQVAAGASASLLTHLESTGSGTISVLTGHTNTGTGVVNVLQDVTGDAAWNLAAPYNYAFLVDISATSSDTQLAQLSAVAAGTMTLSANVNSAQEPLARLYLVSRNVTFSNETGSYDTFTSLSADSWIDACVSPHITNVNNIRYSFVNCTEGVFDGVAAATDSVFRGCSGTFAAGGIALGLGTSTRGARVCSGLTLDAEFVGIPNTAVFDCNTCVFNGDFVGCNSVMQSSTQSLHETYGCTINGTITGVFQAFASCNNLLMSSSSRVYNAFSGFSACAGCTIEGEFHNCTTALGGLLNSTFKGKVVGVFAVAQNSQGLRILHPSELHTYSYGLRNSEVTMEGGFLGCDSLGVDRPVLTADVQMQPYAVPISRIRLRGTIVRSTGPTVEPARDIAALAVSSEGDVPGIISIENAGGVLGAHRTVRGSGDIYKNTSVVRSGGGGSSIRAVPLSACGVRMPLMLFDWTELEVPASLQNRSVYIKGGEAGNTWGTLPTASELYVEARYISNGTTFETAVVTSSAVLTDNATWTEFTLPSFTPAAVGQVQYRGWLKKYQASAELYVDAKLNT